MRNLSPYTDLAGAPRPIFGLDLVSAPRLKKAQKLYLIESKRVQIKTVQEYTRPYETVSHLSSIGTCFGNPYETFLLLGLVSSWPQKASSHLALGDLAKKCPCSILIPMWAVANKDKLSMARQLSGVLPLIRMPK